jgi:hypothetical protein
MEANQKIISANPRFDPTDRSSWQQHLEDTSGDDPGYFAIPFRSNGSQEITLGFDLPGNFAGWTPPAFAHVYAMNPGSGQYEVQSFPIGGYGGTMRKISVGSGNPQEEYGTAYVAVTGHPSAFTTLLPTNKVTGLWNAFGNSLNTLLSPSAYRVMAWGGFAGNQ